MSEHALDIGTKVVVRITPPTDSSRYDETEPPEDVDEWLSCAHWGVGEITATRGTAFEGGGTHDFYVHFPRRKTEIWMRGMDLLTPEEEKVPSVLCQWCGEYFTRLICKGCKEAICGHCLYRESCEACRDLARLKAKKRLSLKRFFALLEEAKDNNADQPRVLAVLDWLKEAYETAPAEKAKP